MGATITPGGGRAVTTWFTADLHLGHHNIIDYCNRSFRDVHAMNDALVENWNEAVAPGDTVWVVGDFALGKIADTLPLVSRLHGRQILVAGNHDRCWAGHGRRADGWTARYRDAGLDEVVQGAIDARPVPLVDSREETVAEVHRGPLVTRTLFRHTIGHTRDTPQARNSTQGAHTDAASCRRSR